MSFLIKIGTDSVIGAIGLSVVQLPNSLLSGPNWYVFCQCSGYNGEKYLQKYIVIAIF